MIISDLEYLEAVSEASEIVGAGLNLNLAKLIDSLTNDIIKEANQIVNRAKKQPKAKQSGKNVVAIASATVNSSKPGNVTAVATVTSK